MSSGKQTIEPKTWTGPKKKWVPIAVLIVVAIAAAAITWLLTNIFERKAEQVRPFTEVVSLTDTTFDSAEWGKNFPIQYESFKATAEMQPEDAVKVTEENRSVPEDPREYKAHSKLEMYPRLVTIWQGYPFSVEYNEPRGHEYMFVDQKYVKRMTDFDQPGACVNCHASVPQVTHAIAEDQGVSQDEAWTVMNKTPYREMEHYAAGPIACIDCHDPETMELQITRPAFIEGIKAAKAAEGIEDFDVNEDATNEEMRSYVCAQCHVEYYFRGEDKTLTFPWSEGLTVQDIIEYYETAGEDGGQFSDFTHATTGAEVIKAQHPDFETWYQGIHAENGVTCADCHMPYERNGSAKVSDHQVRSPLVSDAQINKSCLTCHHTSEDEMRQRVDDIQASWEGSKDVAFTAVQELVEEIEQAKDDPNVSEEDLQKAYDYQRKAQFIVDYTVSENSKGFHAPQYAASILNEATDYARSGQLALRGVDVDHARPESSYDIEPGERPGAK